MSQVISNQNIALSCTNNFDFLRISKNREFSNSLAIIPFFNPSLENDSLFYPFVEFAEQMIRKLLPSELLIILEGSASRANLETHFLQLKEHLPLLNYSTPSDTPNAICFSLLCPADYTEGVGRHIADVLTRWILPGKSVAIGSVQSLNFRFRSSPNTDYYFSQNLMIVENERDRSLIMKNIETIGREIRLNILAVSFARSVIAMKNLSTEQKEVLIKENLSSLLDRHSNEISSSIFDLMHHFFNRAYSERKISLIKNEFYSQVSRKSNLLDKDIYTEIQHLLSLFNDKFTATRPARYISRLIALFYLFRKSLLKSVENAPKKRHLSFKILKKG